MKKLLWILPFFVLASCGSDDEKPAETPAADVPLAKSKNSPEFNTSFEKVWGDYIHLKDGLVLSKDTAYKTVDIYAKIIALHIDSIAWKELKADTSIVAMAKLSAQGIAAEAKNLVGVKGLEEKRKSFQMISEQMYDLIRTVQYDRVVVYHQYCPMAFNDLGAYWLSNESEIRNPYFGSKMLMCGEVKDSLDFRPKQ